MQRPPRRPRDVQCPDLARFFYHNRLHCKKLFKFYFSFTFFFVGLNFFLKLVGFSKNQKISDFRIFENLQKNLDHQKIFLNKTSKRHRKTFQEHTTTPPNSSWSRRTSSFDLSKNNKILNSWNFRFWPKSRELVESFSSIRRS